MLMQNRETCFSKNYFLKFLPFAGRVSIEASRHEQNQSCSPLFFARGGWYVASHFKCNFLASISWLPCRNLPLPDPNKVAGPDRKLSCERVESFNTCLPIQLPVLTTTLLVFAALWSMDMAFDPLLPQQLPAQVTQNGRLVREF